MVICVVMVVFGRADPTSDQKLRINVIEQRATSSLFNTLSDQNRMLEIGVPVVNRMKVAHRVGLCSDNGHNHVAREVESIPQRTVCRGLTCIVLFAVLLAFQGRENGNVLTNDS